MKKFIGIEIQGDERNIDFMKTFDINSDDIDEIKETILSEDHLNISEFNRRVARWTTIEGHQDSNVSIHICEDIRTGLAPIRHDIMIIEINGGS